MDMKMYTAVQIVSLYTDIDLLRDQNLGDSKGVHKDI